MVQEEIDVVQKMELDPINIDNYGPQLESMLQNQQSLISELRECFSYESKQGTELGDQLQNHWTVLTTILEIVKDEFALACELESDSSEADNMIELIETLQQSKLTQISELQAFSESHKSQDRPVTIESQGSGSELLLSESFRDDGGEDAGSDFEDLRM